MTLVTRTPGVYREGASPARAGETRTGIPAFLGYAAPGSAAAAAPLVPRAVESWADYAAWAEATETPSALPPRFLPHAVRGFFRNGGGRCWVVPLPPEHAGGEVGALRDGLAALEELSEPDLVAAPDIMHRVAPRRRPGPWSPGAPGDEGRQRQALMLAHCRRMGDRFALLDALPALTPAEAAGQASALAALEDGAWGALYYPWVLAEDGPSDYAAPAGGPGGYVPPCGHVAGVYARTDRATGVHRPPANEPLEGVLDVEAHPSDAQVDALFPTPDEQRAAVSARRPVPVAVNALRAFPGRGIRVWGARTLSADPARAQLAVRRTVLSVARWLSARLGALAFEPNVPALWARIAREAGGHLAGLHRAGVLRGATPEQSFYVRCDAALNPPEAREAGVVTAEVGLAPAIPNEFIVVRVSHDAAGATITGP